jgi:thioesterase domain-containing protein
MKKSAAALQEIIHQTIPLGEAMGFKILELSSSNIITEGPLEPNVNIHGTGFAGSIYSLATLSAWALVTHAIAEQGLEAELVIARADIKYRAPVQGTIHCECRLSKNQLQKFFDGLVKKNHARLEAEVNVGKLPEAQLHSTLFASHKNRK